MAEWWQTAEGQASCQAEWDQLAALENPDGEELRRMAELAEILFGDEVARKWWVMAAAEGCVDAVDMLEVLVEEDAARQH